MSEGLEMPEKLKRGNVNEVKGVWELASTPAGYTALMSCPECGKIAALSDHTIEEDGSVHPSVVCPRDNCTFHKHIQLEGWREK